MQGIKNKCIFLLALLQAMCYTVFKRMGDDMSKEYNCRLYIEQKENKYCILGPIDSNTHRYERIVIGKEYDLLETAFELIQFITNIIKHENKYRID